MFLAVPDLHHVFRGDHDLAEEVLQAEGLDPVEEALLHPVFEARIGVHDEPVHFRHEGLT